MTTRRTSAWSPPTLWAIAALTGAALLACGKTTRDPIDTTNGGSHVGAAGNTARGGAAGGRANNAGAGNSGTGAGGREAPPDCGITPSSQIPRLTSAEYDRTLRDLLGVTQLSAFEAKPPSAILPPDHPGDLNEQDWAAYLSLASAIAAQVMADPKLRPNFMACTPIGDGAACLRETIIRFGRRAFRRPLSEYELARFEKIVAQRGEITATGAPAEIAEVLLETFLASPSFLQRAEVSQADDGLGHFVLSSYEVASRLSYALWGSMPDEVLSNAADSGALVAKDQIRAQAERMLADPKARELVSAFHRAYMEMDTPQPWAGITKDPARFPGFDATALNAMREEADLFFDTLVFERRGTFTDLLNSPLAFVNAATAPLYGLDASKFGAALEEVTLDESQRPGFLTRIGFLSANSYADRTSPADRGGFILRQVLGTEVPPHPVDSVQIPAAPGFATNRERVVAETSAPVCTACHRLTDPFGFVLEAYDAVGQWQTAEADTGAPIDTVARVQIDDAEVDVRDPRELMLRLADSSSARETYVRHWVEWIYARAAQPTDDCLIDQLSLKLASDGYSVLDVLVDITQSEAFRLRTMEVSP
ncbi:MAG: DUF1592 domain-containing protein [Myxococcota bacterium]